MAESVTRSYFPSQVVSDETKQSEEYGLKVANAIETEWFNSDTSIDRYSSSTNNFHKLRLYARGEQSIQKYKDELSINGDLSYLNLDWKPVPIIPKFVDIVVNGIAERTYDVKAYSQDPYSLTEKTNYMEGILADMEMREFDQANQALGLDTRNSKIDLPETKQELELHMQLDYKQSVELAQEQAINLLLEGSKYELIKKRFFYDITTIGIGAVKNTFNTSEGAVVEYVDPSNLVYSYSNSPYFDDIYYVGEVKTIPINELIKQFPTLSLEELEDIVKNKTHNKNNYHTRNAAKNNDNNTVQVLYYSYKTYMNETYKVKTTATGASKVIEKPDSYNPPENMEGDFGKIQKSIEVVYEGAKILDTNKILKWELSKNMLRPKSDYTKVMLNYSIVAPRMYEGRIESLVSRITGFADMIQLTHLKLQQILSRMVPDGVYLDADGLAEVDLGNGTNYNPQEALNMFFQTGSVIGRSYTQDGDMNAGKIPIQEITSGSGGNKMQALIGNYNYYLQMIRDTTGLNEARDGSTPDKNALVGVQKLAAANSNTATRHILQAGLFLTAQTAECLSLRISDILEYSPTKDAFIKSIGAHNVATLDEIKGLHLYDFGIFIELQPDEEEKQLLENNIQMALQQKNIELEDAIDVREIRSVKLANQVLKLRRGKKQERDRQLQLENIEAQTQSNSKAAQQAAQIEMQKNQALMGTKAELANVENELSMKKMQQEVAHKKELMALEFEYNMKLKSMEVDQVKGKEKQKEDRKDERTRIQASQQSELIEQRNMGNSPKNFESAGNDTLGGGFDLGSFDPR
tara:strand:+ start:121 stop:2535 length:2415 start_codon:yes stop_codon:yes gene_type:complete